MDKNCCHSDALTTVIIEVNYKADKKSVILNKYKQNSKQVFIYNVCGPFTKSKEGI